MARRAREGEIPEGFRVEARRSASGDGGIGGGYLGGQLLIAMPGMADPRFAQSLICLCAHSPDGAMGIVLNKPLEDPSFEDLLKQLDVAPTPPARRIRLLAGGPVEGARGFVLHTADWSSEGSLHVGGEWALTASVDILKAIAEGGGPREGVLALGYAGWGPGQLEDEIHQNAWLNVTPDEALLFDPDHDAKWRRALRKLRVDPLLLSGVAGRA
ncbi:YqgE/AlgH family protein [Humitalea sp. 24SJ18S-53]|uniref:YqgE/AlgH family protein n=1 Tax=Humitalea sp. 24SJ18S-53 TaxID=3422307 RepID=UPI003D66D561